MHSISPGKGFLNATNMSITQYFKDTRAELNHVAWPTRTQTFVFTALVIGLSVVVSLYLGIFDYLFTNALGRGLELLPGQEGNLQLNMPTPENAPVEVPVTNEETPALPEQPLKL